MIKKIVGIFGIVLMMLMISVANPVMGETNETKILGRTHIRAIGNFHICEDDGNLYGHIFIGFLGFKPVFNLDIEICQDYIKWIVMTKYTLNCVIKE